MFISDSSNHCPVHLCSSLCKFSQRRKCHLSWQTHYSLINNSSQHLLSHFWEEEKKTSFIFRFCGSMCFMENTGERGHTVNAFHLGGVHLRLAGQQWPWEYSEANEDLSLSWKMESAREGLLRRRHTSSPFFCLKSQNKQPGQSPDTFPSNFHCRMCSFSG